MLWVHFSLKDVTYQYFVFPSVAIEDVETDRGIDIIANNRYLQAVRHSKLDIAQIVFYQAGEIVISEDLKISIDSPGVIMLKIKGSTITELAVSDPSRKLGKLHLTLSGKIETNRGHNWSAIYNSNTNTSDVTIDLPLGVYAGKSVVINF